MAYVVGWSQLIVPSATGAGVGVANVFCSGTPSIAAITCDAHGRVEVTGTGAPSIAAITAAASGSVEVTGSGTPSIGAIAGAASGDVEVVGTGAGTIAAVKMRSGIPYDVTIKYRPQFVGPEHKDFGEVFDLIYSCEYRDGYPFDVTIKSDYYRKTVSASCEDDETVETNEAAAGQPYIRHSIQIVPPEGLYGTFFEVTSVKKIHSTGLYKAFGFEMHVIPRPGVTPEFIVSCGSVADGW